MARMKTLAFRDGPSSPLLHPMALAGNATFASLAKAGVSAGMAEAAKGAPRGACVFRGIAFEIGRPVVVAREAVTVPLKPVRARWLVFAHLSDARGFDEADGRPALPPRGEARLGERAADYVIVYEDGEEARLPIRRRREIGVLGVTWGESPLEAVNMGKPFPVRASLSQKNPDWGRNQTQVSGGAPGPWVNWIYAAENPRPGNRFQALRFEPVSGAVVVSGVSAGDASENPLCWRTRRKALLTLPRGVAFNRDLDEKGRLEHVQLDMGQVVSAVRRPLYPNAEWRSTYNNKLPEVSERDVIIEYTSHPDARFHLPGAKKVAVADLEARGSRGALEVVAPASERVTIEIVEKGSGKPVAAKLHIHGEAGEYLAPVDRHRIPNPRWFEDYSTDFTHLGIHHCTYVPGRTVVDLPVGKVYVEVSRGFEIKPVRKAMAVRRGTRSLRIEIAKVLPWREKGWVSADTHVHFLSPHTALLEGAGEGVNVVNLLASQWGELMTNVGDFDGRTTLGRASPAATASTSCAWGRRTGSSSSGTSRSSATRATSSRR